MSIVYLSGQVKVAAYPASSNNIERHVATIGLQYDLAAVIVNLLLDVCGPLAAIGWSSVGLISSGLSQRQVGGMTMAGGNKLSANNV